MLETFRNLQHSWFIKIFLVLTAASFMSLFGVAGYIDSSNEYEPAMVVGDISVSAKEINEQFIRNVRRMQAIPGYNISMDDARQQGVMDETIHKVTLNTILDMATKDLGMEVPDELVRDQIFHLAEFKDHKGEFDRYRFTSAIRRFGFSEKEYIESMRGDIRRDHLWSTAYYQAPVPEALTKQLYTYRFEKRSAELINIKTNDMPEPKAPTKDEMDQYLADNSRSFMAPEYRKLTVVAMTPETVGERIERKTDDLKAIYQENIADYTTPEKRLVDQMQFDGDKKDMADKAAEELAKGKDFRAVAKDIAKQSDKDTDLGWVSRDIMLGELSEATFDTAKGDYVGPLKSQFGWHIVKVRDIDPKVVVSFEDAREKIEQRIIREQAFDLLYNISRDFEDELGRGTSMEEAAEKFGFATMTIAEIDPVGNDKKGNKVAADIATPDFLETAFSTYLDEESRLQEHDKGFFMLRVEEIIDPAPKTLELVEDKIATMMKAERKAKAAREKAEDLLAELQTGKQVKETAAKAGLEYTTSKPMLRRDTYSLPGGLVYELFSLKKGDVTMAPTKDGYVVAKLKDIISPDPEKAKTGLTVVENEVRSDLGQDLRMTMIKDFSRFYSFEKNENVLNQLRK